MLVMETGEHQAGILQDLPVASGGGRSPKRASAAPNLPFFCSFWMASLHSDRS